MVVKIRTYLCQNILRKLRVNDNLLVKWIPGPSNDMDLHTKNLDGRDFEMSRVTLVRTSTQL